MITVNLYYTGENGSARKFAEEMESSGTADKIRAEKLLFFADHAAVMLLFMLAGYAVAVLMSGNSSSKKVS